MTAMARQAVLADLKLLLSLYQQLNPAYPPPPDDRASAIWNDMLTRPGHIVFVAEQSGTLAATCTLIMMPNLTRSGTPYGLIENVVTDAAVRRSGLGRAVMLAALSHAWDQGCYKVMLLSGRSEESGVPTFYESVGFKRGFKTGFIAFPPS
ncbi:MAG: GNAT family N-acetyltransferase [Hyphomicrobiales bacterium]|nr:GNAT family N-acetyltransferase [Hyphomicrobiales bacterium]